MEMETAEAEGFDFRSKAEGLGLILDPSKAEGVVSSSRLDSV